MYVIHLVPNAPMQRIFYEIYRDRAAFDSHESQPYMQRFVAERRACVLATNVIELQLKYAKVAPLPNPQAPPPRRSGRALPAGPAPLPPPAAAAAAAPLPRPQPLPAGPATASGPGYQPVGPRYAPARADRQRSDQGWPDQRQVPSAGRPYGG